MSSALSPLHQLPLMKLIALQSFINAELASVLDYLLPPWPRHFCRECVV